jgi:hypothetical protein
MWLLDANMDVHLVELLRELGISSASATLRGWQALENGALVGAAVSGGFSCLLTRDRLFAESAARALKQFDGFAVVVVQIPQRPWRQYAEEFRCAWNRLPIHPVSGSVVYWP